MLVRVGDGRRRSIGNIRVIQAVHGSFIPHREPLSIGVDRKLNRRVSELALDVGRGLPLLE